MSETRLRVPGMECGACEAAVTDALTAVPGVSTVSVDLDSKLVRVEHDRDRAAVTELKDAVEDTGFDVTGWDPA